LGLERAEMDKELEAILEESRRAYEEEQEIRKLVLEIEKGEEEERQQQELRHQQEVETVAKKKREEQKEQEQEVSLKVVEESDAEYDAAIQASLTSHDRDKNRHHYNQRTQQLLESLDQPPPGRFRQCIEIPKDTGQLVVGVHHHHTKEIARRAGGDCKIRFLPRNISINFDGVMGDCLLIEASNPGAIEIAETWLVSRVADLFFQDTKVTLDNSEPQSKDVKWSTVRKKKQEEVLERLPSFQPAAVVGRNQRKPQVASL
jgi:hypothetical protein